MTDARNRSRPGNGRGQRAVPALASEPGTAPVLDDLRRGPPKAAPEALGRRAACSCWMRRKGW
jgi:hypothetical protein